MKRNNRNQRGTVMVEMAIVLPIFILILMGTIEFGLVLHDYLILQNASREGARLGAVGSSEADIQQRVRDFAPQLQGIVVTVRVDGLAGVKGTRGSKLEVTAKYSVPLISPSMNILTKKTDPQPSLFGLTAKSTMRLE